MIELVIASLIASIAYVYAPLLRIHAARRLRWQLPANVLTPDAGPLAAPMPVAPGPLPDKVEKFCLGWRDEWARKEAKARAYELYAEIGDWDKVLVVLERES